VRLRGVAAGGQCRNVARTSTFVLTDPDAGGRGFCCGTHRPAPPGSGQ